MSTPYPPFPPFPDLPIEKGGVSPLAILFIVIVLALVVWAAVVARRDSAARQSAIAQAWKTNPDEARAMMHEDEVRQKEAAHVQEAQLLAQAVRR